MKIMVLYRPDSEHARTVEEFIRDFARQHGSRALKPVDVDSIEGMAEASLYDILEFPALLAMAIDGQLMKSWTGLPLPLMDEVAGYLNS